MKNDLLEKIDVEWLCFLSLSLVCATYGISAESRNLSNFKTVDYWHRYFADLPRFTGLYCGSKEDGILSQSGKVFQKGDGKRISLGILGMFLISILGTALLRWLNGEVTTANQASLIEEFKRGNGILLPIMLGVLAPIVEEIIFRGILPLKIFKGYEGWGYIVGGLLFALFHGPTNIVSFVIYAVSSVILTLLAYRTRRLEVSIAVHMINNGLPAIIMLLIGIFGMEV